MALLFVLYKVNDRMHNKMHTVIFFCKEDHYDKSITVLKWQTILFLDIILLTACSLRQTQVNKSLKIRTSDLKGVDINDDR